MSKYIFRIEHKETRRGPYVGCLGVPWQETLHNESWRPTASEESKLCREIRYGEHYFGFDNLGQLKHWFTRTELKKLNKLGFRIRRYKRSELGEIVQGDFQVIFKVA